MFKGDKRESGFTLLELLVAISILSFGLLATATMLTTSMGSGRLAHRISVESDVAYSVLDEFLARSEDDATFDSAVSNITYDLDKSSAATTRDVQGITYSATYSITPDNPVTGVARIDITLNGTGGRTLSLSSLKRTI